MQILDADVGWCAIVGVNHCHLCCLRGSKDMRPHSLKLVKPENGLFARMWPSCACKGKKYIYICMQKKYIYVKKIYIENKWLMKVSEALVMRNHHLDFWCTWGFPFWVSWSFYNVSCVYRAIFHPSLLSLHILQPWLWLISNHVKIEIVVDLLTSRCTQCLQPNYHNMSLRSYSELYQSIPKRIQNYPNPSNK